MTDSLKKTPLYENHASLSARMGPFAGWDMPIQYEGILAEHHHTRTAASIFDTCHMGEFDVQGPNAEADLENLVTCNVGSLKEGQCRYGFLCNDAGGVIGDLTVYRRSVDHFTLVVNAGTLGGDAGWICDHLSSDSVFTDRSPDRAKIDVQGPQARTILEDLLGEALPELGYFRFVDTVLFGVPLTLSRTGYTGEWGYELYLPNEEASAMWERLTADGRIKPAGLGARDTLRLEMGYALYGHELGLDRSPWCLAGGMFIGKEKDFVGKAGIDADRDSGTERLAAIILEGKRAAREGTEVVKDGRVVGVVTSGSVSPTLGTAVALAYVERGLEEPGQALALSVRGKELPGTTTTLPFHTGGSARG